MCCFIVNVYSVKKLLRAYVVLFYYVPNQNKVYSYPSDNALAIFIPTYVYLHSLKFKSVLTGYTVLSVFYIGV